ncbi:MAG: zinc transporter ZupT [Christensenellales bacterium]|jgi:ZIP family zinc transporter
MLPLNNPVFALLLATGAGMATLLGALIIFFVKVKSEKLLTAALGFSAGMMIAVSLIELFPSAQEAFAETMSSLSGTLLAVACLIGGVLIARLLDSLVPHDDPKTSKDTRGHKDLLRVGMVSAIAIMIHNFPEGIATFMAGYSDPSLGITLAFAIAMHNIPEGISVALPIYYATNSKGCAFFYTFLSGVAEPIGAVIAWLVLAPFISAKMLGALFSIVSGIMLYIAFEELLPSSRQYGYDRLALWSLFAGVCIMPISMVL